MIQALGAIWAALSPLLNIASPPSFSPAHDQFVLEKSWGVYSPFHAVEEYVPPPPGCKISQVNILHRHGARLPTETQSVDIISGVTKLQSAETYTDSRLDFLNDFEYSLDDNLLVPLGAIQSFRSGKTAFDRYSSLVSKEDLPFVRASGMSRVVETAKNWSAGFAAGSHHKYTPRLAVILNEEGNDTLQDNNCPNAASSHREMAQWLDIYAQPITARLNSWAPGADLANEDIHGLMMLCAFHTVASVTYDYEEGDPLPFSPFCSLFTESEFKDFQYSSDIDKYYSTGYGGRLGRVQGVGYTNELLARLTRSPVKDHTSTNVTLNSDPATFPLNRTIYVDFTHDSILIAVYHALGLFPTHKLDTTQPDPERSWRTSDIMTFSSRMVVEKLSCDTSARGRIKSQSYIRIMANEMVQPLAFCGAKDKGPWRGMCKFEAFLKSQKYARKNGKGDWEKCFLEE
ncbi:histidine phosphatase superfamily [Favolaschia claudopus]|uniref:Phytase A n=1 Tax=Favolaschia claudopus TaxID=2862362 RepID=A0AAW0E4G7_9AGAR